VRPILRFVISVRNHIGRGILHSGLGQVPIHGFDKRRNVKRDNIRRPFMLTERVRLCSDGDLVNNGNILHYVLNCVFIVDEEGV